MLGFFRLTCLFAKEKLGREKVSKPIWLACQLRYSVAGHVNKTVDTGFFGHFQRSGGFPTGF